MHNSCAFGNVRKTKIAAVRTSITVVRWYQKKANWAGCTKSRLASQLLRRIGSRQHRFDETQSTVDFPASRFNLWFCRSLCLRSCALQKKWLTSQRSLSFAIYLVYRRCVQAPNHAWVVAFYVAYKGYYLIQPFLKFLQQKDSSLSAVELLMLSLRFVTLWKRLIA